MDDNVSTGLRFARTIWTRPRTTIQQIVTTNPRLLVFPLAAVAGISSTLDRASMRGLGDRLDWPSIVGLAVLVGPVVGIVFLFLGGALLRLTGEWLRGEASAVEIRASLAWSGVPMVASLVLWIPMIALFGNASFGSSIPRAVGERVSFLSLEFLGLVAGLWSLVLLVQTLRHVQGFSTIRCVGNIALAALLFSAPFALIALVIAGLR